MTVWGECPRADGRRRGDGAVRGWPSVYANATSIKEHSLFASLDCRWHADRQPPDATHIHGASGPVGDPSRAGIPAGRASKPLRSGNFSRKGRPGLPPMPQLERSNGLRGHLQARVELMTDRDTPSNDEGPNAAVVQQTCSVCGHSFPREASFCPTHGATLRSPRQNGMLGMVLADRYRLDRRLGAGGMGEVFAAFDIKFERDCAVKFVHASLVSDENAMRRFMREGKNLARVRHPNVADVIDSGDSTDGRAYLVMELVEGVPLTDLVVERTLTARQVGDVISGAAAGLQAAHDADIVHRDVKPDNIVVRPHDDGWRVKVIDFGIAKATGRDSQLVTSTGQIIGTPDFMAPEQIEGLTVGVAADQYALALVAFLALTGKLPFPASATLADTLVRRTTGAPMSLREVNPLVDWPEGLEAALARALARRAEDRFASIAAFAREFCDAVSIAAARQDAPTVVVAAHQSAGVEIATTPSGQDLLQLDGAGPTHVRRLLFVGVVGLVLMSGAAFTWNLARGVPSTPTQPVGASSAFPAASIPEPPQSASPQQAAGTARNPGLAQGNGGPAPERAEGDQPPTTTRARGEPAKNAVVTMAEPFNAPPALRTIDRQTRDSSNTVALRAALRSISAALPRVATSADSAQLLLFSVRAHAFLGDHESACRALSHAQRIGAGTAQAKIATTISAQFDCP